MPDFYCTPRQIFTREKRQNKGISRYQKVKTVGHAHFSTSTKPVNKQTKILRGTAGIK